MKFCAFKKFLKTRSSSNRLIMHEFIKTFQIMVALTVGICLSDIKASDITELEVSSARISKALYAYDESAEVEGFKLIQTFEEESFKASVYDREKPVSGQINRIIGFRGSINTTNYMYVFHSLINKRPFEKHVQVLKRIGIYDALINLNKFVEINTKNKDETLYTGHSLGGFLTQMFSSYHNVSGIGFDSPKISDYESFLVGFKEKKECFELSNQRYFRSLSLYGDKVSWFFGGLYLKSKHPDSTSRYLYDGVRYSKFDIRRGHSLNPILSVLKKLKKINKKYYNVSHEYKDQEVVLKSYENLYFSRAKKKIYHLTDLFGSSEKFYLERNKSKLTNDDYVFFKSQKGHYLSCDPWGHLNQSYNKGYMEKFKILKSKNHQDETVITCSNMFGIENNDQKELFATLYNDSWTIWEFINGFFE